MGSKPGSVFMFTDATDRLWPEISSKGGNDFLSFIFILSGSDPKHTLLMVKVDSSKDCLDCPLAHLAVQAREEMATWGFHRNQRPCGPFQCHFVNAGGPSVQHYIDTARNHCAQFNNRRDKGFRDQHYLSHPP